MERTKTIKFYKASSYLLLLGVIHSAMTPVFYPNLTIDALWFFGTGLGMTFLCFINLAASRVQENWLLNIALYCTIASMIYNIFIVYVLKEPQAYIGAIFHGIVLFFCVSTIFNLKD